MVKQGLGINDIQKEDVSDNKESIQAVGYGHKDPYLRTDDLIRDEILIPKIPSSTPEPPERLYYGGKPKPKKKKTTHYATVDFLFGFFCGILTSGPVWLAIVYLGYHLLDRFGLR